MTSYDFNSGDPEKDSYDFIKIQRDAANDSAMYWRDAYSRLRRAVKSGKPVDLSEFPSELGVGYE